MVDVKCSSCSVEVLVIPSALRREISEDLRDEVEAHVSGLTTVDGQRLVIADETGHFTCPVCGTLGETPLLRQS